MPYNPNAYFIRRDVGKVFDPSCLQGQSPALGRTTAMVLGLTVALSGCETATAIKDSAVAAAATAGTFISTQASNAADFVMGRKSGSLEDDGTTCFASARVPFYAAVDEVTAAQRLEYGAMAGVAVATFAAFYADSVVAKIAAVGFGAVMVGVIANIEADHDRITAVNRTFTALIQCREREAKKINQEYGQDKVTHAVAVERLDQLRSLMAADVEVAQGVNAILTARNDGYVLSTKQAQQKAPPPKGKKETQERKQQTVQAQAGIQSNQRALSQQTASIQQAESLTSGDEFQLSLRSMPWLMLAELTEI